MNLRSSSTSQALRIVVLVAVAVHIVSAAFHVYCGGLNIDEGFYAIATRAVMAGEMPYRDFGYTQMPLLPYVNGPGLALFGYGLFEQRWLNGLGGALALGLAGFVVARRTSPLLGVAVVATFSLLPPWMHFIHLGKTYGFTSFVAMAAATVFLELRGGWKKLGLLGFLAVLGVGCRLPAAPFFGVLWLAALWHGDSPRLRDAAIGFVGLVLAAVVLLLPFYLAAPESARFWALDFHAVSVRRKQWTLAWEEIATLAPIWWAGLGLVVGVAIIRRNFAYTRAAWVGIAAAVALAANLLPRGVYEEYGVPFLPPFAVAVTCGLARLAEGWSKRTRIALVAGLLAVHAGAAPLILWQNPPPGPRGFLSNWLTPNAPAYNAQLPAYLARARSAVEQILPVDQPFIGPHVILAAETGRVVPRKLRMGSFSTTMDFPPEQADRLHLLTYPELFATFSNERTPLVAFSKTAGLNYGWSMPSFQDVPAEEQRKWRELFQRDFLVAYEGGTFWILARPSALPSSAVR